MERVNNVLGRESHLPWKGVNPSVITFKYTILSALQEQLAEKLPI